jgi:hypothetical protein
MRGRYAVRLIVFMGGGDVSGEKTGGRVCIPFARRRKRGEGAVLLVLLTEGPDMLVP